MQNALQSFLKSIGEDPNREGLRKTPARWEASLKELTGGYDLSLEDIVSDALFDAESSEMVIIKNIAFHSLCEHHILPFTGTIHVGYLPNEKIIGFSKIPRIVEMFTHRLQTQEHLGKQICDAVEEVLKPRGIGVVIEANHLCMAMRGARKQGTAITTHMRGHFESDLATRQEFLALIGAHSCARKD